MGITIRPIKLSNSKTALIIRIPKSWNSPHCVSFKKSYKFYGRNSNGKYLLDVGELRIAFNLSETISEKIRQFRIDRISRIISGETPILLSDTAKIVLHLIPFISFNPGQNYDINKIYWNSEIISQVYSIRPNRRHNFDGLLYYLSSPPENKSYFYVQIFKNGIIEAVDGILNPSLLISNAEFKKKLINSLPHYLEVFKTLNVEFPMFMFISLLGVKGYSMAVDSYSFSPGEGCPIDRDILLLPEVIIENYNVEPKSVLKPCFDSIWNACGFPMSPKL